MTAEHRVAGRFALLSGGVGGAKLAVGLSRVLPADDFTAIANTGDDFVHLGLRICPDLDTLAYTLAGIVNPDTGWGRREETWNFMSTLGGLGGETWFRLGDRDLAVHVERTRRLAAGEPLSQVTRALGMRLGVRGGILPMSDHVVSTFVRTVNGELPFQEYFVRQGAIPRLLGVRFAGAEAALPAPGVLGALTEASGIIVAPSNPFLSIDPILAVPGVRACMASAVAPVVAVSPIVGGEALKGPTAKIMTELGLVPGPLAIAQHYAGILDGLVIDELDARHAAGIRALGIAVAATQTVMRSEDDKLALAQFTLEFAGSLAGRKSHEANLGHRAS